MATVAKVYALVKYSPKRENLLGKIYKNIESKDSELLKKLKKLSTARWTVRAENVLRESLIIMNRCWNLEVYVSKKNFIRRPKPEHLVVRAR